MRTKFFLLFVLILGLTLNGFSQEKTIYKQTIYKGARKDATFKNIQINATCDIVISFGEENAVYFNKNDYDKEKFKAFVIVDEDKLIIDQPSLKEDKPFSIRLQLVEMPSQIVFGKDSKVYFNDIVSTTEMECFLEENAKLSFVKNATIDNLMITLEKDSKISFDNIASKNVYLQGPLQAEAKFERGNIENLTTYNGDSINVSGNCKISSINKDVELPIGIISNMNLEDYDEIVEDLDSKINPFKQKWFYTDVVVQFNFGGLRWNRGLTTIDDFFSLPEGVYDIRYGNSWSYEVKVQFVFGKKWDVFIGVGLESNVFYFRNNLMLMDNGVNKQIVFNDDEMIDAKSKLVARYSLIPLKIRYKINKNFNIHVGGTIGFSFRSKYTGFKRDYSIPNAEVEERWGEKYNNFKPIKAEVQAGIGYRDWFSIYAKYALTPLFKTGRETTLYPYSIGFSLGL
ncbi:MAG: PorT family protein [Bacteroidales bacterium]|jgi:hypothetical protein|nr:PorT family protein [Bacteroidales bacterium]